MTVGSSAEVSDLPPTERTCESYWLLRSWCEQRVAWYRADAVRQGMMHAWAGYKAFAWGADEIHPKSKTAKTDIMVGAAVWRALGGCSGTLFSFTGGSAIGRHVLLHAHLTTPEQANACAKQRWRCGASAAGHVCACCRPGRLLTPVQGGAGIRGMGVSLVDALSTLKVMGLDEQFKE